MFGPNRPHLFIARKFPTGSGGFRSGDRGLFFGRERCRRFIIGAGQAENNMGNIVLCLRGEIAHGFKGLVEKLCHPFTTDSMYIVILSAGSCQAGGARSP